jgi:hypothetical protein
MKGNQPAESPAIQDFVTRGSRFGPGEESGDATIPVFLA